MTERTSFSERHAWLQEQEGPTPPSHGNIQWKGTDVCIDMRCVCGYQGHLDESFAYYYKCHGCDRLFALSTQVKLIELPTDHRESVERKCQGMIKTDTDGEQNNGD